MKRTAYCLCLLLAAACNPDRIQYTKELKQEMADSKIKRISIGDMNERVDTWGRQMADVAQRELQAKLAAGTPANVACTVANLPKTRALSERYGVAITLQSSADVQNVAFAPKEREVLAAYLYNVEKKLPLPANVQRISDTLFVYSSPVPVENPVCKACFAGQAQPLVVWRLAFPKRELIRRMQGQKK